MAYEVLETRFGKLSRRLVSSLFLLTRNASDALRLFLTALVLQVVLGLDLNLSVMSIGTATILYTFVGGARSLIWNDCIQFVIYMVGAAAAAYVIVGETPGGLDQILRFANEGDKLRIFDFRLSLAEPSMTFWAGIAGGAFLTAATHGTDQMMVQRYLSARNQREASMALGASGFIVLLQFTVFLLIGVGLATLFGITEASSAVGVKNDQLFAYFIVNYMPAGLLGITVAAVFAAAMSTLSSSLKSSAAAFINDFYLPLRKPELDETGTLFVSRAATVVFGLVQIGIAQAFGLIASNESIIANVLKISGFAAGPVLGLYFLGVFAPRVRQRAALTGFVVGVSVLSAIAYASPVHWAWYALLGSMTTVIAGNIASRLEGCRVEQ
jgi:SSS family transporter